MRTAYVSSPFTTATPLWARFSVKKRRFAWK